MKIKVGDAMVRLQLLEKVFGQGMEPFPITGDQGVPNNVDSLYGAGGCLHQIRIACHDPLKGVLHAIHGMMYLFGVVRPCIPIRTDGDASRQKNDKGSQWDQNSGLDGTHFFIFLDYDRRGFCIHSERWFLI
jgi:hypothetical protein